MTKSNPLLTQLADYTIILASGSPRRQGFLKELEIPFKIQLKEVEEVYPQHLKAAAISDYLAVLKAKPFTDTLNPKEIVITADTVVWHNDTSLAKAANESEAAAMLNTLSGDWHKVITSVCFTRLDEQRLVHQTTEVKFKALTTDEIAYYVAQYKPYDKAGAYGIQEWLGLIAIEEIKGSYSNVVGLPTHLVYKTLMDMVS